MFIRKTIDFKLNVKPVLKKCIVFLILLSVVYFSGCINSPDGNIQLTGERIHIVGDYGSWNTAFYWNDGTLTVLDEPDGDFHVSTTSVTVSNGTVYVGGEYNGKPCYWVDGTRHDIDCDSGSISGIAVDSSGQLRLAGECSGEASVWTGGTRTALDIPAGCSGTVTAMILVDDSLYACGSCIDEEWAQNPCYWTDGEYTALPVPAGIMPGGSARAYGIAVDGTRVIVAGTYDSDDAGAGYWSDGVWNDLDGTSARGVAVSGSSVCIVGRDSDGACFWLNRQKNELEAVYSTIATAIGVSGNDLVAAGKCGPTGGDDTLGYWSGGSFVEILERSIADVNGIFISD